MSLEDVAGIRVGHWTDLEGLTGVTVVVCPEGTVGSGELRGGAPGTRETALLAPAMTVERVDAIVLCGGSAFGLGAVQGVMEWLEERGRGYPTRHGPVPIVPAAVIYDLGIGSVRARPGPAQAVAAIEAGNGAERGTVGAGTGAMVGLRAGAEWATKGGLGQASERLEPDVTVAALAVVNTVGDVLDEDGRVLAGCRHPDASQSAAPSLGTQTALLVVATDARLSKLHCYLLAQQAQDGLAATVRPAHTRYDGDTAFSLSTGAVEVTGPEVVDRISEAAGRVMARAIRDAVRSASPAGGVPAATPQNHPERESER